MTRTGSYKVMIASLLFSLASGSFAAEQGAEPDAALSIVIDGRRATGLMELATRFPDVRPLATDNEAQVGAALAAATIKVRPGQKIAVKVERPALPRRQRDVTASPNLEIYSTLDQVTVVRPGELLVQASPTAPTVLTRPGVLQVHFFYFTDSDKKHYEYNEIYLEVVSQ